MLNTTKSLPELIKSKYECQKRISINNRHINDLKMEGVDVSFLILENEKLKDKIDQFNRMMEERYSYSSKHIDV
jgi:hypothetical protein